MEKISHPTAVDGQFTAGDPSNGILPTVLTADWANDVQDEVVNVIEGAGIALDGSQNDQLLQAIQTLTGSDLLLTQRNALVNGDFALWQRGPRFSVEKVAGVAPRIFTADRWSSRSLSGSSDALHEVERTPMSGVAISPASSSEVINQLARAQWSLGWWGQTGILHEQRVEFPEQFSGEEVTFSCFVGREIASAAVPYSVTAELFLDYGVGGAAPVSLGVGFVVSSGVDGAIFKRLQVTATVPEINVETDIGPGAHLAVRVFDGSGVSTAQADRMHMTGAQLEFSSTPTAFQQVNPASEYIRAARYYQTSRPNGIGIGNLDPADWTPAYPEYVGQPSFAGAKVLNIVGPASDLFQAERFRVPMRTAPSMTIFDSDGSTPAGAVNLVSTSTIGLLRVTAIRQVTNEGFGNIDVTNLDGSGASIPDGTIAWFGWAADAEI